MVYSTHLLRHLRFTIGYNIYRLRAEQKLTLKKLSRISGVAETQLDYYEIGRDEIKLDEVLKIACALRTSISEIVGI